MAKSKSDGSNPPVQSLYTTLENLGIEDVEMEIERIGVQLEDARLHPDRMTAAVDAATRMGEQIMPSDMAGLDPASAQGPALDPSQVNTNAVAAGSPNRDALVEGGY